MTISGAAAKPFLPISGAARTLVPRSRSYEEPESSGT
jgi:hypothetical protein